MRHMSVPRASMGFRPLPPQWLQDIGRSHADPHTRFGKRRGDRFHHLCRSLQWLGGTSFALLLRRSGVLRPIQLSGWDRSSGRLTARPRRCAHSCWRARRLRYWDAAVPAAYQASGFWDPACPRLARARRAPHGSARCAQVAITTFTDAEQAITAATGSLLGYQPEPGSELATILEALPITDRGDQR